MSDKKMEYMGKLQLKSTGVIQIKVTRIPILLDNSAAQVIFYLVEAVVVGFNCLDSIFWRNLVKVGQISGSIDQTLAKLQ